MSFPLDYRGEITGGGQTGLSSEQFQQHFVSRMAAALEDAEGAATVDGNRVSFTGGLFRSGSRWNILVPITKGYIEVRPANGGFVVSYSLNFKQLFVTTSVLFVFGFTVSADASAPVAFRVGFPLVAWLWLFGMNILITLARFPAFISRVLYSA